MLALNISTILLQMANFVILAFILYRFLFKPLQNTLQKRDNETTKALDEALIVKKEAEETRQKFEEKTNNLDAEIAARKNEARIVIEQTRQQMLQEVQAQIDHLESQTEETLAQLRTVAIQQHQEEIGNLTSDFAQDILSDLMTPQLQEVYQDKFLNQLSELNLSTYMEGITPDEVSFIRVVMPSPPKTSFQDKLASMLNQHLSQEFNLSYEVDPSLIAGGILRFENELIDGSLKGQINHLKQRYQDKK